VDTGYRGLAKAFPDEVCAPPIAHQVVQVRWEEWWVDGALAQGPRPQRGRQ